MLDKKLLSGRLRTNFTVKSSSALISHCCCHAL
ncbi:Uncharacterised protein [Vibrio cholerae]|nr:Uncharacterised protein [Vibrio cholerae]